jgi:hypothetical protein
VSDRMQPLPIGGRLRLPPAQLPRHPRWMRHMRVHRGDRRPCVLLRVVRCRRHLRLLRRSVTGPGDAPPRLLPCRDTLARLAPNPARAGDRRLAARLLVEGDELRGGEGAAARGLRGGARGAWRGSARQARGAAHGRARGGRDRARARLRGRGRAAEPRSDAGAQPRGAGERGLRQHGAGEAAARDQRAAARDADPSARHPRVRRRSELEPRRSPGAAGGAAARRVRAGPAATSRRRPPSTRGSAASSRVAPRGTC